MNFTTQTKVYLCRNIEEARHFAVRQNLDVKVHFIAPSYSISVSVLLDSEDNYYLVENRAYLDSPNTFSESEKRSAAKVEKLLSDIRHALGCQPL